MYIIAPTYNQFEACAKMIKSAEANTLKPEGILIIDNSGYQGFGAYLQSIKFDSDIPISLINSPVNLGCARAWNQGLELVYRNSPESWCLVVNDDIEFHPDCIELFDRATRERSSIVYCAGGMDAPNAFSLFCTRYDVLNNAVGMFDPLFIYPYCEDGDMARRLMLAGHELDRVEGASAHHIGSATLKAFDEQEQAAHHNRFKINAYYFQLKWKTHHNDIYSKDGYTVPFDGDEIEQRMAETYVKKAYGV